MPSLGSLWYTVGLRDMTDADIQKINDKLTKAGSELTITPKLAQTLDQILPNGKTGADWDSAPEEAGTLLMWQS